MTEGRQLRPEEYSIDRKRAIKEQEEMEQEELRRWIK